MASQTVRTLRRFYGALHEAYGPQHWWPGDSPTEVVIGAILTQNTNWQNVEKAIAQLQAANLLGWRALRDVPIKVLEGRIRSAGYYRVKARRLKNFVAWLWREYHGDLEAMRAAPLTELRRQLLSVNGIGPETADSILLYALGKPTFVVDAYTRRVARRHRLIGPEGDYAELKALFEDHLPEDVRLFNEYHALLVAVGKKHCRPQARCPNCPLEGFEHDVSAV